MDAVKVLFAGEYEFMVVQSVEKRGKIDLKICRLYVMPSKIAHDCDYEVCISK